MTPLPSRRAFLGTSLGAVATLALPDVAGAQKSAKQRSAGDAPAPAKNLNNPFVYRFNIGALEAWSISDGHMLFDDRLEKMWPPTEREAMQREMVAHGERIDGIPLYVNILVLRRGREVVLCDAGFGVRPNPNTGWLAEGLKAIGITADQVTHAILSHGHGDHIGGLVHAGKPAFPNASVCVLKEEVQFWRAPQPDFSKSHRRDNIPNMIRNVRGSLDVLQGNLQLHRGGDQILGGAITIEAAPGHTDGHCALRIRDGRESLVHIMDVAHHHVLMFTDPSWFIEFDHHPEQAVDTRKKLFAALAGTGERVYGFHLPWPGIGRILPRASGYHWVPERWSWGS